MLKYQRLRQYSSLRRVVVVLTYLLRFTFGGTIVAGVSIISKSSGPRLGGMLMLIPAVTIMSLYFVGRDCGTAAIGSAARGGLIGLIPLALFLISLSWLSARMPSVGALMASFAVWVSSVVAVRSMPRILLIALVGSVPVVFGARWLARQPLALVATMAFEAAALTAFGVVAKLGHNPVGLLPAVFLGFALVALEYSLHRAQAVIPMRQLRPVPTKSLVLM